MEMRGHLENPDLADVYKLCLENHGLEDLVDEWGDFPCLLQVIRISCSAKVTTRILTEMDKVRDHLNYAQYNEFYPSFNLQNRVPLRPSNELELAIIDELIDKYYEAVEGDFRKP